MYNKDIKERFITDFSSNTGRRQVASIMFETLEQYEKEAQSDFCTWQKDRLKPVVCELIGLRENSKKTRLSILKTYVKWCVQNNIPGAREDLLEIDDFGLDKLKRQMVANPQHLQRFLNCILEPEQENTVDNIYRCYFWLAYGGMSEDEVFKVSVKDVDLMDMVVRFNGKEFPIYKEAVPAFRSCVERTSFKYKHPNYIDRDIYRNRIAGDILLRGTRGYGSVTGIRVEISRKQKEQKFRRESTKDDKSLDLQLSHYRVKLSGLFYRVYEAERAGIPVDFMPAAEQFMDGKTYKLDSGRNLIESKQRRIAVEFLEDYNRWKEAFSI